MENTTKQPVTVSLKETILPEKKEQFEAGMAKIGEVASAFPGHMGLNILRPSGLASHEYVMIFRFDTEEHLQAWEDSKECKAWQEELKGYIEKPVEKQVVTGLEFWFTLPGSAAAKPPPAWKMLVVTFIAIFPLSQYLPKLLLPYLTFLPVLARSLVVTAVIVTLMTYVVMPLLIRLFSRWLFIKRA